MKILLLIVIAAASLSMSGCNSCSQDWSHLKSETVGLNRTVTLYDASGSVIRSWDITSTIEDSGGSFRFVWHGKAMSIAGTVIVEEK